jgi:hypothetical protein
MTAPGKAARTVVAVPVEVIFSTEPFPRLGSAAADRSA